MPAEPVKHSSSRVRLLSPKDGAELPNGTLKKKTEYVWAFDWEDVPEATKYNLFVMGASATIPMVNRSDITASEWENVSEGGYVAPKFRRNWTWKVRAFVNGAWTEWSEERHFDVQELR